MNGENVRSLSDQFVGHLPKVSGILGVNVIVGQFPRLHDVWMFQQSNVYILLTVSNLLWIVYKALGYLLKVFGILQSMLLLVIFPDSMTYECFNNLTLKYYWLSQTCYELPKKFKDIFSISSILGSMSLLILFPDCMTYECFNNLTLIHYRLSNLLWIAYRVIGYLLKISGILGSILLWVIFPDCMTYECLNDLTLIYFCLSNLLWIA